MHTEEINIEYGLQNLVTLKTSDFGRTIRYIPLETTDESLVGGSPVIKVLKDYIVVESQRKCLLFDKKDGRFIAEIGSIGQGPDEYNDVFSWTDEKEEFLYFLRRPNQLLKFDMKGNFSGRIAFSSPLGQFSYYLITDSEIIEYFKDLSPTRGYVLGFFDKEGVLKDSIPSLFPATEISADEIKNISIFRNTGMNIMVIEYKNDTKSITCINPPRIWKHNGSIRFKEDFIDTIYTVSNKQLMPSITFNTGKYRWPAEERNSVRNTNEHIFIADISENKDFIFFKCISGLYADGRDKRDFYTGLFHKKTGETKIGKTDDLIADDLTHFMPLTPLGISTAGEFVSLVEAYKIMEWVEEHPEAKNNEQLAFLKNLDEEMNPVIILIE